MTYLRKKRDRRDYQIKRFMMFPQRVILPEYGDSPSGPEMAMINGVWSLPEPEYETESRIPGVPLGLFNPPRRRPTYQDRHWWDRR